MNRCKAPVRENKLSNRYLDYLFGLRCAPQLLAAGLFPNAKEWTEAYGCFQACMEYIGWPMAGDGSVLALDVGCGTKPRLAAFVACRTRWNVIAIDPRLRRTDWPFKRLSCRATEAANVPIEHDGLVVSMHCHSHAPLDDLKVDAPRHVIVALPCCKKLRLSGHDPVDEFDDAAVISPKRTVRIYDVAREAVLA